MERMRTSCLFPISTMLTEVRFCLELWDVADLVRLETCGRIDHAIGLSPAIRLCSRPLLDRSPLVDTSYCTCIHSRFSDFLNWSSMLTHWESSYYFLYPASVSIPMETGLLFNVGTCWTWCRVIVLPFGNWMGTSPTLAIAHSYSFPSRTVPLVSTE